MNALNTSVAEEAQGCGLGARGKAEKAIIRRCKGWRAHKGVALVFVNETWLPTGTVWPGVSVAELEADDWPFKFSDGICPECSRIALAELGVGVRREASGAGQVVLVEK